jgi:hypothetical protein
VSLTLTVPGNTTCGGAIDGIKAELARQKNLYSLEIILSLG